MYISYIIYIILNSRCYTGVRAPKLSHRSYYIKEPFGKGLDGLPGGWTGASEGLEGGLRGLRPVQGGFKGAWEGLQGGFEKGFKGAWEGLLGSSPTIAAPYPGGIESAASCPMHGPETGIIPLLDEIALEAAGLSGVHRWNSLSWKLGCSYLSKEDFGRAIVALTGAVEHACILSPVDMAELIRIGHRYWRSFMPTSMRGWFRAPPPSKVPFNWSWRGPRGGRGEGGLKVWRLETLQAPFKPRSCSL